MALKRIKKELNDLMNDPLPGSSVGIGGNGENLFCWEITVIGPDNTPYEGGVFLIKVEFPADYPFRAPKLTFLTKIYHPNVSRTTGAISYHASQPDLCGHEWSPAYTVA